MERKAVWLGVVGGVVIALVAAQVLPRVQRDREWAHGGDATEVAADVRLVRPEAFTRVVSGLGVPRDEAVGRRDVTQAVVAKLTWTGSPHDHGWFNFIAIDKRISPPAVLPGGGGWSPAATSWNRFGGLSSSWISTYDGQLAEHYGWLAGLTPSQLPDGSYSVPYTSAPAVLVPAARSGTAMVWFISPQQVPAFTDPRELSIAVFYVEGGDQVRWAKRIFG